MRYHAGMIVAIKQNSPKDEVLEFVRSLEKQGVQVNYSEGAMQTVLGLVGDTTAIDADALRANHLVEKVVRVQEPYKRANRMFHPDDTVVEVPVIGSPDHAARRVGGGHLAIIAGPCSVESQEQVTGIALAVKEAGAGFLRGGAFKPRTSPYSFQGLGIEGLVMLQEARKASGLPIVTELMSINQLEIFDNVDVIQIGARNMQNFTLLKEVGHSRKPILLKRGYANTLTELLMAAEYIMAGGNDNIILCERGIRSFDTYTRNVLDLAAVPYLKRKSHLPVIVDPSHGTGHAWMVPAMSKAAIAAGADGLIIEVHNNPEKALCDGDQSITPPQFAELMATLRKYAEIEGKTL
jgi:3-deoxy-7-phosphoheptulonate synthase